MYISTRDISKYVIEEAKHFAERLSETLCGINVTIKKNIGETYIIIKKTGNYEMLFFILDEDGKAKLLLKKNRWYRLDPVILDTVKFAEWNGFVDPFELSLYVQMHIYEAVKKFFINQNAYASEYEKGILLKYSSVLNEYNDPEPEPESSDEAEVEKIASDCDHTIKPPYIDVSKESYLDSFFERYR